MKLKKKVIAGALAAGLVMGAGGIAAAYFSAHASGTGTAVAGTYGWTVSTPTRTGPTRLFPGGPADTFVWTVTNTGSTTQVLKTYTLAATNYSTVTIVKSKTATHTSTVARNPTGSGYYTGCTETASTLTNFLVSPHPFAGRGAGTTVAPSGTATETATVALVTTGTQNACQGVVPYVTLTVHSKS